MGKEFKIFLIIFGIACLSFVLFFSYYSEKAQKENLDYNFSGIIDSVSYDIKGLPIIKVADKEYFLGAGYNFDFQIEKGDILKKQKESSIYTLIKHKTGKIIVFKH